ncbi:MAG TPA: hypothetical protein VEB66_12230 [Opitutaceae bacterium]|nr:hypothetical protein [Opitutaceae bacterium]
MTDQFTSLSSAAIKEILSHIDNSLSAFEKYKGRMSVPELQVKSMLTALRKQMAEQLQRQAEREGVD